MISRVKVKNYRSLRDVDVTLGQLNVLVGKNGAGKSSFLDAIALVRDALKTNIANAVDDRGSLASLMHSLGDRSMEIEISIEVSGATYTSTYGFRLGSTEFSKTIVAEELAAAQVTGRPEERLVAASGELNVERSTVPKALSGMAIQRAEGLLLPTMLPFLPDCKPMADTLRNVDIYELPTYAIKGLPNEAPFPLSAHGENLGSFLHEVCKNELWKSDIVNALGRIVDDVTNIRVHELAAHMLVQLEHNSSSGTNWRFLHQESEGTIRALAILAALYQTTLDNLIVIEEPELHLHPGALGVLADVIKETSLRRQVLITTQSPDLISYFAADELLVVENVEGKTQIGPIAPAQRDVINSELFSGGDLLRIEGLHSEAVGA